MKHILKSYGRAVLVAILGPTIRAMDPTDPMFGRNA
jgi:hypothetical protein